MTLTEIDVPTNRRSFLRHLGAVAAIGVGAAASLSPSARAKPDSPAYCCKTTVCNCPPGYQAWYCTGACGPCCICYYGNTAQCIYLNCPC
jgi:hypothetical protein